MATPSENVFLGDLPATIDEATLVKVFSAYGTVKSHKILPLSARGSGGAILSFGSVEEATWVVNNLNGNIPQGLSTPISVSFKTAAGAGGGGWGGGMGGGMCGGKGGGMGGSKGGAESEVSAILFVGDLPPTIDEATLVTVFGAYGTILSHKILNPGTSGAAAIIQLSTVEEAKWCVDNLDGNIPQGLPTPVKCRFKQAKAQKSESWGGGGKDWGCGKGDCWGGGGKDWGGGKGGGNDWGGGGKDWGCGKGDGSGSGGKGGGNDWGGGGKDWGGGKGGGKDWGGGKGDDWSSGGKGGGNDWGSGKGGGGGKGDDWAGGKGGGNDWGGGKGGGNDWGGSGKDGGGKGWAPY